MITDTDRYHILDILGLKKTDKTALWTLLDAVSLEPAAEAKVLALMAEALEIIGQKLLLSTDEIGLTKANQVERDPRIACRQGTEGLDFWRDRMANLIGWEYVDETVTVDPLTGLAAAVAGGYRWF